MRISFTIPGQPPTATSQQKGRTKTGVWYKPPKLKAAEERYLWAVAPHRPSEPLCGPLGLAVTFYFAAGKTHHDGDYKVSRPDTDNMIKLLKDTLTRTGFWKDDAQVCTELTCKRWATEPRISVEIWTLERREHEQRSRH